ncbi:Crp/Fnr family transcriptional regulator [Salibacter halophilus]|uniref:Crp/Fnr family transcriptional regulator n=1 Tax=Salibacter halophilus TaxID=1803916 RepID=A0A6N6M7W9_9FLAO|nr:Crp/Fnr family transcriptional regulator [Salibacter halophilus]KAB1064748.1 Crp/Fnr family transcriptional regulator [Salibacter halophilus]
MFQKLHSLVEQFVSLTDSEKKEFENAFIYREVPRNFTLVHESEIADELYFINSGLLRLYYNKDGEHITAYIFREHLFSTCFQSFLEGAPGNQNLESMEDCELLVLKKDKLEELYERIPKINILVRKIAEQRFINAQRILSSFILESPEQRYKKFAQHNSDLFLRIPHHIIASYLGITPVSLSRIRKRLIESGN